MHELPTRRRFLEKAGIGFCALRIPTLESLLAKGVFSQLPSTQPGESTSDKKSRIVRSEEIGKLIQNLKDAGLPTAIEDLELPELANSAELYNPLADSLLQFMRQHPDEWANMPPELDKVCTALQCGPRKWSDIPPAIQDGILRLQTDPFCQKLYESIEKAVATPSDFFQGENPANTQELRCIVTLEKFLWARAQIARREHKHDKSIRAVLVMIKLSNALSTEPTILAQDLRVQYAGWAALELEKNIGHANNKDLLQTALQTLREVREEHIAFCGTAGEMVTIALPGLKQRAADSPPGFILLGSTEMRELRNYVDLMRKFLPCTKQPYWQMKKEIEGLCKEQEGGLGRGSPTAILARIYQNMYRDEACLDALLGATEIALLNRLHKLERGEYADSLIELGAAEQICDPFTGKAYIYRKEKDGFTVRSRGQTKGHETIQARVLQQGIP